MRGRRDCQMGKSEQRSLRNKLATARMSAERHQLMDALRRHGNNRSKAAQDLGISRVALYKRLHKFEMM